MRELLTAIGKAGEGEELRVEDEGVQLGRAEVPIGP